MGSFSQTWHRLIKPLRKKKSSSTFQTNIKVATTSSKTVRFYGIDEVFYTHSSIDYDRTPVAEITENDFYYDDEYDDEDEYDEYDQYNEYNEEFEEEEEYDLPVTPTMISTQFDYHHIEPSIPINFLVLKSDNNNNNHSSNDHHHMVHGTTSNTTSSSSSNHSLYENPSLKNVKLISENGKNYVYINDTSSSI